MRASSSTWHGARPGIVGDQRRRGAEFKHEEQINAHLVVFAISCQRYLYAGDVGALSGSGIRLCNLLRFAECTPVLRFETWEHIFRYVPGGVLLDRVLVEVFRQNGVCRRQVS